jgi:hypothetical protein
MRKGEGLFDGENFSFARSEYPDRVRYEADCVRYIIGELAEKPFILDYDSELRSDYVEQPDNRGTLITELQAKLVSYECTDGQPTELELHRADYQSIKSAGFESPGELLDAYLNLQAKLDAAEKKVSEGRDARIASLREWINDDAAIEAVEEQP